MDSENLERQQGELLPGLRLTNEKVRYSRVSRTIRIWREACAEGVLDLADEEPDFRADTETYLRDAIARVQVLARRYPDLGCANLVREGRYLDAAIAYLRDAALPSQAHSDAPPQATPPTLSLRIPSIPTNNTSWDGALREQAIGIMQDSAARLPNGTKFQTSTAMAILLLCFKQCGANFFDPRMADTSITYFQQIVDDGLIVEPHWMRPGHSDSRSMYKGWNDFTKSHSGRVVRAKYESGLRKLPSFIYGLTTSGEVYCRSALLKTQIHHASLEQRLAQCKFSITLPLDFPSCLKTDPDYVASDQFFEAQ